MAIVSLWIYIVMLVAGGLAGWLKARSKASLIMSWSFALVLALCALGALPFRLYPAFTGLLLLFFGYRFLKTKKFMPMGLMFVLSLAVLAIAFATGVITGQNLL
jgi:uncharacterized membrane protein (UPF0136 family)